MKKIFLVAAIAVFGFSTVQAQDVKLGAKAGVNFAKLSGDDLEDADGRLGIHLGLVGEIPVSEKFAVQPELVYSTQGLQSKFNIGDTEITAKRKLDYFNIPVMAKFYVTEGLAIEAGPQIGFLLNAKDEVEADGDFPGDEFEGETDIKDEVSSFDMGIGGGLSYSLENGAYIGARYIYGLTNVDDAGDDTDGEFFEGDLVNSVLSLSVGFRF